MSWGQAFSNAYNSASAKAQQAASVVATSVGSAVDATVEGAKVAGRVGAFATRAAVETAEAGARGVVKLADKAAASAPLVGGYYQQAKQALSPTQPPRARVTEPCPNSIEGKIARLEQRNALIAKGQAADSTPDQKAAAERLARDNQAVELARLSGDAYAQYESPRENHPPLGWTALSDTDLGIAGIDPNLVHEAKAVVYQTPPNWPGGQQTVLAFRGTNPKDPEDMKTDADQALGKETVQYKAAAQLGTVMSQNFGSDVIVTGHSLGGGKAQAAGISGGLTGMMFNSAGLHPNSVGGDVDAASQFTQFRAPADPLTGLQNSAALQTGAGALAGGVAMPFSAGMLAGYNWEMSGFVLGAEADFNYLGFSSSKKNNVSDVMSQVLAPENTNASDTIDYDSNWFGTVRARLGYAIDNVLIYGTGGIAYGKMDVTQNLTASNGSESASWQGSTGGWNMGWTVGGGVEYGIDRWTLGAEYLYVDLGSYDWRAQGNVNLANATVQDDWSQVNMKGQADLKFSIARATVKYRF